MALPLQPGRPQAHPPSTVPCTCVRSRGPRRLACSQVQACDGFRGGLRGVCVCVCGGGDTVSRQRSGARSREARLPTQVAGQKKGWGEEGPRGGRWSGWVQGDGPLLCPTCRTGPLQSSSPASPSSRQVLRSIGVISLASSAFNCCASSAPGGSGLCSQAGGRRSRHQPCLAHACAHVGPAGSHAAR